MTKINHLINTIVEFDNIADHLFRFDKDLVLSLKNI